MTNAKQQESTIRSKIISYMELKSRDKYNTGCCTWWFKFHVDADTKTVRRELEKMEREGIVISDHSQSNNTIWKLIAMPNLDSTAQGMIYE